ncbi:CAP domain-containing protein [Flavihumibacter sp. UBA7668]|uniref:CAP domain-containing protein n=1 Tax=Flavihumibacter sp. UBA7668 TaxID=1946542 RepID=UPI0025C54617|nr:CAP domain-containing protein [Flavihumibacter sp. UBA7668]
MMKSGFWLLIIIVLIQISCKTGPSGKSRTGSVSSATNLSAGSLEQSILLEINNYRKKKGLAPLRVNAVVATEASLHSQAMARKQVAFGHGGYGGRVKRISSRLEGLVGSAENVAVGTMSAAEVVKRWINSPTHRKNIEGPYNLTGIGVSKDATGRFYYTQLFIRK